MSLFSIVSKEARVSETIRLAFFLTMTTKEIIKKIIDTRKLVMRNELIWQKVFKSQSVLEFRSHTTEGKV